MKRRSRFNKNAQKPMENLCFCRLRATRDAQDEAKMGPRWPKMTPRCPKMAPRWPQDGPKMAQRGSKIAPRSPPEAPKRLQDDPKSIRHDNNNTETVACQAKCSTHRNLRCFWDHAGAKLAPRWPQNCFKLAPRSSKMVPRLPHVGLKICLCGQCIAQTRQDKAQYH